MHPLARGLGFASLFAALLSAPALAADQFINVLTGGTSGVYYPLGVALANGIGKAMPARQDVGAGDQGLGREPEPAAGRARRDRIHARRFACPTRGRATRTRASRRRSRSCAASRRSIRTTSRSSRAPIPASRRSPTSRARTMSVGAPKSGTELNARAILAAAGLSYKDFSKVEYLPFGESGRADEEPAARRDAAIGGPRRLRAARSRDVGRHRRGADSRRRRQEDQRSRLPAGDDSRQYLSRPDERRCRPWPCRTTSSRATTSAPTPSTA